MIALDCFTVRELLLSVAFVRVCESVSYSAFYIMLSTRVHRPHIGGVWASHLYLPVIEVRLFNCSCFQFIILGMDSGKILILSISGDKIPGLDIDVVSVDCAYVQCMCVL